MAKEVMLLLYLSYIFEDEKPTYEMKDNVAVFVLPKSTTFDWIINLSPEAYSSRMGDFSVWCGSY